MAGNGSCARQSSGASKPVTGRPPVTSRKGCNSFAAISPGLRRRLDSGEEHPLTLAEWLAIDSSKLLRAVLQDLGLETAGMKGRRDRLLAEVNALRGLKALERSRGMGEALHRAIQGHRRGETIFERCASHRSPVVRSWAAYALLADPDRTLKARIAAARRFAADEDMAVRECAWVSFREWLARDLDRGLRLLEPWVGDKDAGVRRCAVEATRPRGVWTRHIDELKENPGRGLALLEPVRSDPSRYVRTAVGNWLNDASRSRPGWVRALCRRWLRDSPTDGTAWIVNHATRGLRRKKAAAPQR